MPVAGPKLGSAPPHDPLQQNDAMRFLIEHPITSSAASFQSAASAAIIFNILARFFPKIAM
jgi:hypothetical protein